MTDRVPLGEKENLHQEFKSRDALKKLETIAREVVAMLNAEGGMVWVGLRDENDRAVAVETIPNADREQRRLRDYLVDTIEPSPAGREVEVEVVSVEGEGEILRVRSKPERGRAPYAHLKEGGRLFVLRTSDRVRPMTREEVSERFRTAAPQREEAQKQAAERLLGRRTAVEKEPGLFWLGIEPTREIEIDLHDPKYTEYLMDPAQTGNRRAGWSFAKVTYPLTWRKDALVTNPDDRRFIEIRRDGGLTFGLPLNGLWRGTEPREIWPYALLEYPVSAFRIARKIYEDKLQSSDVVLADLALIGIAGSKLRRSSPGTWDFQLEGMVEFRQSESLIWERPLQFPFGEVLAEPDRCGYRLVERVYEAFGYGRDAIPLEFDQKTGRLIFNE